MLISPGDDGSNRPRNAGGPVSQCDARFGRPELYGILAMQAIVACLGGLVAGLAAGSGAALALIYGVALMGANGVWLYRGIERATRDAATDGQHLLYRSAVFRFLFLLLALGLAHAAGLFLPWVAAGMLAAQAMVYIYGLTGFWRSRA